LNLLRGTFPRSTLCSVCPRHAEAHFSQGISMAGFHFQSGREMSRRQGPNLAALMEAAKPYLMAILMVAMLLSVWISFRAG
jgi:hypothetical protein